MKTNEFEVFILVVKEILKVSLAFWNSLLGSFQYKAHCQGKFMTLNNSSFSALRSAEILFSSIF